MSAYDFLQTLDSPGEEPTALDTDHFFDANDQSNDNPEPDTQLLVNATKTKHMSPSDLRRILSSGGTSQNKGKGQAKLSAKMHQIEYQVSAHRSTHQHSLVDRGANGGVAGSDVTIISRDNDRTVDIQGIDNHQVNGVRLGTVGGVMNTHKGPVIGIFHNYALHGKGHTIHSPGQFEWFKNQVCDKSANIGGKQRILTADGYAIPLTIRHGLARLELRPYTNHEWDNLPHVMMTDQAIWDPNVLDHEHDQEEWFDARQDDVDPPSLFDHQGNYLHREVNNNVTSFPCTTTVSAWTADTDPIDDDPPNAPRYKPREFKTKEPDYKTLRPLFGWLDTDTIRETFKRTTQFARIPMGTHLKRFFKSPNPALNVHRRNESVATDIIYADEPAIDNGSTSAVIFYGCTSTVTDVHGVKTDKEFVNTLEDNIRQRGAPNKLLSDRAQVEISKRVLGILRALFIGSWQSEPHQQQQNPAERRIQTVKNTTNRIMDRTGAPGSTWLLCLCYVCYLLNHSFNGTIQDIPMTKLTGSTVDISPLLRFAFWDKVYYKMDDSDCHFPSTSKEGVGHIVGISEHVGHAMTWKILTLPTRKIIYRSQVRPFDSHDRNIRADIDDGETPAHEHVKTRKDIIINTDTDIERDKDKTSEEDQESDPPTFNPEELIGRTFLLDNQEDGQLYRARIAKAIDDHESSIEENPTRIKFVCSVNNDKAEEIFTYNKILDFISKDEERNTLWKFKRISAHQGPLTPDHKD